MSERKAPAHHGSRFAYDGLDRVIHERARLGLLSSLSANPKGLRFADLKQLCALTDGNLSRHLQVLQGKGFRQADQQAKISLLTQIDRQAKQHAHRADAKPGDASPHYFTLMKQLTLYGFFTSEPGATRVVRYRPNPGKYKGCIPYVEGETFWAW